MAITNEVIRDQLLAYLNQTITLAQLVDWAEDALNEGYNFFTFSYRRVDCRFALPKDDEDILCYIFYYPRFRGQGKGLPTLSINYSLHYL